jgi:hypothetical protein
VDAASPVRQPARMPRPVCGARQADDTMSMKPSGRGWCRSSGRRYVHRQRRLRVRNERRATNGALELHQHLPPPRVPPATPPGSGSPRPPQIPRPTLSTGPPPRTTPSTNPGPATSGTTSAPPTTGSPSPPKGSTSPSPSQYPSPPQGVTAPGALPLSSGARPQTAGDPGYPVTRLVPLLHCHHSGADRDHPARCRPGPAERRR